MLAATIGGSFVGLLLADDAIARAAAMIAKLVEHF